jgi:hypothetical protein
MELWFAVAASSATGTSSNTFDDVKERIIWSEVVGQRFSRSLVCLGLGMAKWKGSPSPAANWRVHHFRDV